MGKGAADLRFIRVTVFISLFLLAVSPALASNEQKPVVSSIVINAPRPLVWKTITDDKKFGFTFKKREANSNEAIIEEKFPSIPFMGTVSMLIKISVKENEILKYDLLESEHVKTFKGDWKLSTVGENKTNFKISSYVDAGLPVPRFLVNAFLKGRINKRLRKAKTLAEASFRDSGEGRKLVRNISVN